MRKKVVLCFIALVFVFSTVFIGSVNAENQYAGQVVKMEGLNTIYYVTAEGNRYVFPNGKAYKTWFIDFTDAVTISEEELMAMPLAGNVRYRPGVLMVKIQTDPKVYAVTQNGVLRWIKTEQLAKKFYGENWNILVDDIPDSFFTNYTIGEEIDDESDYDADEEINNTDTIEGNRGLKLGHAKRANTTKCRAIPAVPATPGHKGTPATPATPAVPARECKLLQDDSGDENDTTAPVINDDIAVVAASTTATVTWTTDENSTSVIEYAEESLATATSTVVEDTNLVTDHSVDLAGLIASTTYYFMVKSVDGSNNVATSTEDTFITTIE